MIPCVGCPYVRNIHVLRGDCYIKRRKQRMEKSLSKILKRWRAMTLPSFFCICKTFPRRILDFELYNGLRLVCLPKYYVEVLAHTPNSKPMLAPLREISYLRCPNPGKGVKRKTWDFARLKSVSVSGTRSQDIVATKPMCRNDFIAYFTSEAPTYLRFFDVMSIGGWSMFDNL